MDGWMPVCVAKQPRPCTPNPITPSYTHTHTHKPQPPPSPSPPLIPHTHTHTNPNPSSPPSPTHHRIPPFLQARPPLPFPSPHSLTLLLRTQHQLRPHIAIEVRLAQRPQLHGALLERESLRVRVLGHLGCHVVADDGVEARDEHEAALVEEEGVSEG